MIDYKDTLGMGFAERHLGTKMLRYAANYAAEQQQRSYEWNVMVTKNIYPRVAAAFGSTPTRVERNMRAALTAAGWKCTNSEAVAQLAQIAMEKGAKRDEG